MQSIKIPNVHIYFFLKYAKDAFRDRITKELGGVLLGINVLRGCKEQRKNTY